MLVKLEGVSVRSIGACMPSDVFDLQDLEDIYGPDEVKRIINLNGITQLRIAPDEICASDLCENAANQILTQQDREQIQGVVFVSQTPDYILPSTSASLQHRLGLSKECVTFDICTGCPGYIYGLYQAALLVSSGSCKSVLVCAGDVITRFINPLDKLNRMVFGDAGSATIVTKGSGSIAFNIISDGSGQEHLIIPAGGARYPKDENSEMVSVRSDGEMRSDEDLFMNGIEIMNFSVREVPKIVNNLLNYINWAKQDVGIFGLHQSNKFMLDYLRKVLKVSKESVPIAMEHTGNTGPASIPLMLSLKSSDLNTDSLNKALLCGFGVGLSCAAVALDLSETKIYSPPVEI